MTYTDIDKQDWKDKIKDYLFSTNIRWSSIHTRIVNRMMISASMRDEYNDCIKQTENLLTQAKAEQREEDARIAEKQKYEWTKPIDEMPIEWYVRNKTCSSIASEIRGQHE